VFPLFFSVGEDWGALPLAAGRGTEEHGSWLHYWNDGDWTLGLIPTGQEPPIPPALIPLAWNVNGHRGVFPLMVGEDYLHVMPLYWSWNDHWLLFPLAVGKGLEKNVSWLHRYDTGDWAFGVLPMDEDVWPFPLLIPLAWKWNTDRGVLPVLWGEDYFHVFPLYWSGQGDHFLFPLAWDVGKHKGIGPVWWSDDYFHVFPFYWHWDDTTLWFPLALDRQTDEGREFRVLWRLFSYVRKNDERLIELQPLFSSRKDKEGSQFSILWRLFELNNEHGKRSFRILFSPRIGLGKNSSE
jgi:hypothetical protein